MHYRCESELDGTTLSQKAPQLPQNLVDSASTFAVASRSLPSGSVINSPAENHRLRGKLSLLLPETSLELENAAGWLHDAISATSTITSPMSQASGLN